MKKRWLLAPCLAAVFAFGTAPAAFAAEGWAWQSGNWVYYNRDGQMAEDVLKRSGDQWFYLDGSGSLVYSELVELEGNYYYMNSAGAMVTNQWREIPNESPSDGEPDTWWYYFKEDGKAVRGSSGAGSPKFVTLPTSTGTAKFTFDEEGHMLSGWLGAEGEMLTDEDAWRDGIYYCGDSDDGRQAKGWRYLDAENDEDDRRLEDCYWFYFKSNGKKAAGSDKKIINGKKYSFDEYGAARFDWFDNLTEASSSAATASNATSSNAYEFYNDETQCWLSTGWFKAVPGEEIDEEAYDNEEACWFFTDNNGKLVKSRIKTIKGQRYGFKENGVMLHGLYKITFEEDQKTFRQVEKVETEEDIPDVSEKGVFLYYFGDSPKEGCMKTGDTTLEIDGERYRYRFRKSGTYRGAGVDGIDDGRIYIKGRLMTADRDARYEVFTYEDKDYLISTSGTIMKNKNNIKDSDGMYYCTDSSGIVTYRGSERND